MPQHGSQTLLGDKLQLIMGTPCFLIEYLLIYERIRWAAWQNTIATWCAFACRPQPLERQFRRLYFVKHSQGNHLPSKHSSR